jgi:hypothetical protein
VTYSAGMPRPVSATEMATTPCSTDLNRAVSGSISTVTKQIVEHLPDRRHPPATAVSQGYVRLDLLILVGCEAISLNSTLNHLADLNSGKVRRKPDSMRERRSGRASVFRRSVSSRQS